MPLSLCDEQDRGVFYMGFSVLHNNAHFIKPRIFNTIAGAVGN